MLGPAVNIEDVAPSDGNLPNGVCDWLRVGGLATDDTPGTVVIEAEDGGTATYSNVPLGKIIRVRARKVKAATTAQDITAFYAT